MKAIFAGTPEFADIALRAMLAAGVEVPLVFSQPDRPAGRGLKLQASPVKQTALSYGIAVAQPRSLRLGGKYPEDAAAAHAAMVAVQADVMVVAAYGLILPQWVLEAPRLGCLNIHGSLLPRWRGAAPIHRAIEAGDVETGITIMQMDAGLDTGDMLLSDRLPITATDTTATLHDKLAALGARLITTALDLACQGSLQPAQQPQLGITYAHKIDKAESRIDWHQSAKVIERKIRAFDPFPGCTCDVTGPQGTETLKIWRSQICSDMCNYDAGPGHILAIKPEGIEVQTGAGTLLLTELQRAGGRRLAASAVLRGWPLHAGQILA